VTARTPGKYGKRSPKGAPAIDFAPLLTGVIPAHPVAVDYIAAMDGGWLMLGNDVAGDCAATTWANVRRMVTTVLGATGYYPSQAEVWAIYETQNPGFDPTGDPAVNGPGSPADQGMDLQTLFEYLTSTGGPDGVKAVCFGRIHPKDTDAIKAAIAVFGYVWTGTTVLACNQQEFTADEPWQYEPYSPVEGGHSIVTGGYGAAAISASPALGGDEKFVTWAAETSFTDAFWTHEVTECWVVLWPEHLGSRAFLEGVNQVQLTADYQAITGRPFPAPSPIPAPISAPPGPAGAPAAPSSLMQDLAARTRWVATTIGRDFSEVVEWLHTQRH